MEMNKVMNSNFVNNNDDIFDNKIIDYVLVYNTNVLSETETESSTEKKSMSKKKKNNLHRKIFIENLKSSGLEIRKFKQSTDSKIVYVLIHTPFHKLLEIAEKTKLKLPIELNDLGKKTQTRECFKCFTNIFELPKDISIDKNPDFFTAPYASTLHEKFEKFFNKNDLENTIPIKDRCLLTYEILNRTSYSELIKDTYETFTKLKDTNLVGIDRLLANGAFQAAYPLHDSLNKQEENTENLNNRELLWSYWASPKQIFKYQPLHLVRKYFGEKIAFYFGWLGFYTNWLVLPSIVGILVIIYGSITLNFDKPTKDICDANGVGNRTMCPLCNMEYCQSWKLHESCFYSRLAYIVDNPATIIFSIVMAVWTVLFIEFWKRREYYLQFEWDTEDFKKNIEPIRPEYELKVKKKTKNPITGLEEPYVPLRLKYLKYFISFSTVLFMMIVIMGFIFGIIVYKIVLSAVLYKSESARPFSGAIITITSAIINLVIIVLLGKFYSWLAIKMTDLELQRTDSQYEDSLTVKMYLFQFVNFYGTIFYIAFFKGRNFSSKIGEFDLEEQCNPSGCLIELGTQLAIIMIGKQILNNIQEVLFPFFNNKIKSFMSKNKESNKAHQWVQDFYLVEWTNLTLFDEYLEMVIQLGFMTLFVVAFPLGPLFAFLNNIIEIRIDAYKVVTQLRRPLPKRAQNIGIWLSIISALSKIGVITNGFIIAFTSDFIPRLVYKFGNFNGDSSLNGYVNYSLSIKNISDFRSERQSNEICSYRDLREPYNSPNKYNFTKDYYILLCARLIFVVIFEHLVFFIVSIVNWLVSDVPKIVQDQIERENFIIQKAIWEVKPKVFNKLRCESSSDICEHENHEEDLNLNRKIPSNELFSRARTIDSFGIENEVHIREQIMYNEYFAENLDEDEDDLIIINNQAV